MDNQTDLGWEIDAMLEGFFIVKWYPGVIAIIRHQVVLLLAGHVLLQTAPTAAFVSLSPPEISSACLSKRRYTVTTDNSCLRRRYDGLCENVGYCFFLSEIESVPFRCTWCSKLQQAGLSGVWISSSEGEKPVSACCHYYTSPTAIHTAIHIVSVKSTSTHPQQLSISPRSPKATETLSCKHPRLHTLRWAW